MERGYVMPWIDRGFIEHGIYSNQYLTVGSLQEFVDDSTISGDMLGAQRSASAYWWDDPFVNPDWNGAFGLDPHTLFKKALFPGDSATNVKVFEIAIPNPVGAQFYKQTFACYCDISCSATWISAETALIDYSMSFNHMSRIEYATPYDTNPTETVIMTGGSGAVYHEIEGTVVQNRWISQRSFLGFSPITKDNHSYYGMYFYVFSEASATNTQTGMEVVNMNMDFSFIGLDVDVLDEYFGNFEITNEDDPNEPPEPDEPEPPYDPGGGGDHQDPSDPIPVPDIPSFSPASRAGFFHLFRMNGSQMRSFGAIFNDYDFFSAVKQFLTNYKDCLIGVNYVPFTPDSEEGYHMQWGWSEGTLFQYTTEYAYPLVSSQYKKLDFGTIYIKPYFKNAFDYSPYTKITIWLPYIGFKELPVDEVMGLNLNVTYICDCFSGDCVAFINTPVVGPNGPQRVAVIACYYGNLAMEIPTDSVSFDGLIAAGVQMMGVAASLGLQAIGGGLGLTTGPDTNGAISSLVGSTVNVVQNAKPAYSKSGGAGCSNGYQAIQYPYIIIEHPNQSLPTDFNKFRGYPFNESGTLGQLKSGFAVVDDIQLNNIPAFETEREEIKRLLREGVLL